MAEIAPLNLTTVPFNPRASLPEEDFTTRLRKSRESALKNTLSKFQILNAQENYKNLQLQKKTDAFVNAHGDMLFDNKANALDPNSFKFASPEGRKDLLKLWRSEVGGNYQGFNAFLEMGTQGENKSAIRNLMAARENFRTDKQYKKWVNKTLQALPTEERERLFSMLGDDAYGLVSDLYDVDYGWQGLAQETQDIIEDHPFALGLGATALGIGTLALGARGVKGWRLANALKKNMGGGGKGKKAAAAAKKAAQQQGLVPWQGGPGGMNTIYRGGVPPKQIGPGGALTKYDPKEAARRAKRKAQGLDPDMEIFAQSGVAPTPMNKVNLLRKEWSDGVRTGAITQTEAKAFNKALDSVLQKGDPIHFQTLLPALRKQQGAGNLIRKWGNGAFKWAALPLAGATAGSYGAGKVGSVFGEKGEAVGEVVGGTAGLLGANAVWTGISDVVKRRGMPWVMKRIVSKGGPTLALRVLGKGALGAVGGAFSGGLATALSLGLIMSDVYLIYDILKDE